MANEKLLASKVQVLEHLVAGLYDYINYGLQRCEQGGDAKQLRKVLESARQFADQTTAANRALFAHQIQALQIPSPVAEENTMETGDPCAADEAMEQAVPMQALLPTHFKDGDIVEAYWEDEEEWFKGKITRCNVDEGVYDIAYEDGDSQTDVPAKTIRLQGSAAVPEAEESGSEPVAPEITAAPAATTGNTDGSRGSTHAEWLREKKTASNSLRQRLGCLLKGKQLEPQIVQLNGASVTVKVKASSALTMAQLRLMAPHLPIASDELEVEAEAIAHAELVASRMSKEKREDPSTKKRCMAGHMASNELKFKLLEAFYKEVVSEGGSAAFASWLEKRMETRKNDKRDLAKYRKSKADEAAAKKEWAEQLAPAEAVAETVQAMLESSQRQGIPTGKTAKDLRHLRKSKDALTRGELLEVVPEAWVFSMRADLKVKERAAELQFDPSVSAPASSDSAQGLFSASSNKAQVLQSASTGKMEQAEKDKIYLKEWQEQKRKAILQKKRVEKQHAKEEEDKKEVQKVRAPLEFEKWCKKKVDTEKESRKKHLKKKQGVRGSSKCAGGNRRPKWDSKHAAGSVTPGPAGAAVLLNADGTEAVVPGTQHLQIVNGELRLAPADPEQEEAVVMTDSV
jgi:hypothetical protein